MWKEDILLYYKMFIEHTNKGKIFQSFSEGFKGINTCLKIRSDDSIWIEEIHWMTYFSTLVVWSSMIMSCVELR